MVPWSKKRVTNLPLNARLRKMQQNMQGLGITHQAATADDESTSTRLAEHPCRSRMHRCVCVCVCVCGCFLFLLPPPPPPPLSIPSPGNCHRLVQMKTLVCTQTIVCLLFLRHFSVRLSYMTDPDLVLCVPLPFGKHISVTLRETATVRHGCHSSWGSQKS